MFSLRDFIKRGLLDAVGKQPDYWVILNAAGWLEKGVLTEDDLAEIQAAIDEKNTPAPEPEPDPVVEEPPVESEPVVEPVESESDAEDEGADAEDEQPAPESDGE